MFRQIYQPISAQVKDENGEYKELYCLSNERGYVYSKEEVLLLFEQVKEFYERKDTAETLLNHNKEMGVIEHFEMMGYRNITQNEDGKYQIPKAEYKYKKFNLDKRDWSCKCGWCGTKVFSKTDKGWYSLYSVYFGIISERACSEDCSKLIWKEGVKNWIYENGYQKFFVFE